MKHAFHVGMAIAWPTWAPATEPNLRETIAVAYDAAVWRPHLRVAERVIRWIAAAIGFGLYFGL